MSNNTYNQMEGIIKKQGFTKYKEFYRLEVEKGVVIDFKPIYLHHRSEQLEFILEALFPVTQTSVTIAELTIRCYTAFDKIEISIDESIKKMKEILKNKEEK